MIGGRPRFIDWHFERLAEGARRLGFPAPDLDEIRSEIALASDAPREVVKLIVTRGTGERGYRPPRAPRPTRIVMTSAWPDWPASLWSAGVSVGWCRTRFGRNKALAGIKHLNRLEQVLARAEWEDGALDEGLMLDDRNHVISAHAGKPRSHASRAAGAHPRSTNAGLPASCAGRSAIGPMSAAIKCANAQFRSRIWRAQRRSS